MFAELRVQFVNKLLFALKSMLRVGEHGLITDAA